MAAVTVASGWPRNQVSGHFREYLYKFDLAADADYLDVPLKVIKDVHLTDDGVTAIGVTSITLQASGQSRVVLNSGGALNNIYARFLGW